MSLSHVGWVWGHRCWCQVAWESTVCWWFPVHQEKIKVLGWNDCSGSQRNLRFPDCGHRRSNGIVHFCRERASNFCWSHICLYKGTSPPPPTEHSISASVREENKICPPAFSDLFLWSLDLNAWLNLYSDSSQLVHCDEISSSETTPKDVTNSG